MKVLIAGGSGFIGSHLTVGLVRDGHEVVVLTRGQPGAFPPPRRGEGKGAGGVASDTSAGTQTVLMVPGPPSSAVATRSSTSPAPASVVAAGRAVARPRYAPADAALGAA